MKVTQQKNVMHADVNDTKKQKLIYKIVQGDIEDKIYLVNL